jgi:acyl-CoA thioesterase FadM
MEKYRPGIIDVIFQKQAFYGDDIVSRTQISLTENLPVTVHTILRKGDLEMLASLEVKWKDRSWI